MAAPIAEMTISIARPANSSEAPTSRANAPNAAGGDEGQQQASGSTDDASPRLAGSGAREGPAGTMVNRPMTPDNTSTPPTPIGAHRRTTGLATGSEPMKSGNGSLGANSSRTNGISSTSHVARITARSSPADELPVGEEDQHSHGGDGGQRVDQAVAEYHGRTEAARPCGIRCPIASESARPRRRRASPSSQRTSRPAEVPGRVRSTSNRRGHEDCCGDEPDHRAIEPVDDEIGAATCERQSAGAESATAGSHDGRTGDTIRRSEAELLIDITPPSSRIRRPERTEGSRST